MPGIFDGFEAYRDPTDADYRRVISEGLVVPDANVLLDLYRYTAATQTDLLAALEGASEQLWVPHQVILEFWLRRTTVVSQASKQIESMLKNILGRRDAALQDLRTWANDSALKPEDRLRLEQHIRSGFEALTVDINKLVEDERDKFHQDTHRDHVVLELARILEGRVGESLDVDAHDAAVTEGQRRVDAQLPPGYLDKAKGDGAVGDYLVWKQLLIEAERRKTDVLFITRDTKEDWWRHRDHRPIGPRPELVAELRGVVGTHLYFLHPEGFLKHARIGLQVEIRDESVQELQRIRETDIDRARQAEMPCGWSARTLGQLLERLDSEGPVQAEVIRLAADRDGFVSRDAVYELGNYDEDRTLRGFTRPTSRLAEEFRERGLIDADAIDVLSAVYDPDFSPVQAAGFRVPEQIVNILRTVDLPSSQPT